MPHVEVEVAAEADAGSSREVAPEECRSVGLEEERGGAGKKERGVLPDNTNLLPPLLEPPAAS